MSWFVLDEIFVFETAVSETSIMFKQIKKLKLISKYADIQFFFINFAFEIAISETAVSKITLKRNYKK